MKTRTISRILAAAAIALPSALPAIDTDQDGLDDSVETNTGIYVSPANTGTKPNNPDSDGDGAGDWYEVATIDVAPTAAQPNAPNSAAIKPNIPYPLPAPDSTPPATDKPVKVYILSGQSNMVGQGDIGPFGTAGTLATLTQTENKFPNLRNGTVLDAAGYSIRNDVWYRGLIAATGNDKLKVGQGTSTSAIGPELGFGHVMGYHHDEPVLVLKSSQGGRALGWDFLPPGSVQYPSGTSTYAGYGDSPGSWITGTTPVPTAFYGGYQFDQCFLRKADWAPAGAANPNSTTAASVLDNWQNDYAGPGKPFEGMTFEIAGFAWFQGWNDGLSGTAAYANRYEQNMAQFIRQIRAYYETRYPGKIKPKAPFVIATAAFEGWDEAYLNQYPTRRAVLNAQHAVSSDPVKYPDFVGNVKTMEARGFWRDASISPIPGGGQGFHYNRHAETFMLVGDALGRGMIDLLGSATPDTLPPVITGLNPLDNATGVATGTNLVLTFNEAIALATGDITLKNLTDTTQSTIAVTDASQVSINGTFLTIDPAANLVGGKAYAVQIVAGALKDLSNNAFAGIAGDTTWNFTTLAPDLTAPAISSLSPSDNATGVTVAANLILTFNEPVTLGSGNITIRNLSNSTQRIIPVTDATQVALSGSVLTVNPSANLAGNSNLAIRIDAGAVKDLSNNPFAGIGDDSTWNFATAAPPSSAEIVIVGSPVEGFLNSAKNGFATTHLGTTQISYNAAGADKLVVAIGTEAGNNGQKVNSVSLSFNGIAMATAVLNNTMTPAPGQTGAFDGGYAGIFILDNPFQGPASFTFSASTSSGAPNGAHVTIIGLAGTKPGVGNTGASWATQAAAGDVSTSITSSASKSMVIAMVENSGRNNGSGTAALASGSPMTLAHNGLWGSNWGTAASAYQIVPASGTTITPTFSTNAGGNIHVVAAEFKVSEIPPNAYAVWSAQYPTADPEPALDFDGGGLPTGIEWVVGGDPTDSSDDAGLAPTLDTTSDPDGKFLFTYRRSAAAAADPHTTIAVEYGSDLDGWTSAVHQGSAANQITITEAPGAPGFSQVTVALPANLAASGKLFARLMVEVATS
jgi:methionine-rich copper-binding protein CopC